MKCRYKKTVVTLFSSSKLCRCVQYNTIQYNTIPFIYNTIQYNTLYLAKGGVGTISMDKQYCVFFNVLSLQFINMCDSIGQIVICVLGVRGGSVRRFTVVSIYPLKGAFNYPQTCLIIHCKQFLCSEVQLEAAEFISKIVSDSSPTFGGRERRKL